MPDQILWLFPKAWKYKGAEKLLAVSSLYQQCAWPNQTCSLCCGCKNQQNKEAGITRKVEAKHLLVSTAWTCKLTYKLCNTDVGFKWICYILTRLNRLHGCILRSRGCWIAKVCKSGSLLGCQGGAEGSFGLELDANLLGHDLGSEDWAPCWAPRSAGSQLKTLSPSPPSPRLCTPSLK